MYVCWLWPEPNLTSFSAFQASARWGERINLAEFIAGKQVPELVSLTVGQLVEHITDHLATREVALR